MPTDQDKRIFDLWKKAPKCLWPSEDIYSDENYYKTYKRFLKSGFEVIGYDKRKIFDFCTDTIAKREVLENLLIGQCVVVHALIKDRGGKLTHYDEVRNELLMMRPDNPYYSIANRDDFVIKIMASDKPYWFSVDEYIRLGKQTKCDDVSWAITAKNIADVGIYPEITKYLKISSELSSVRSGGYMIAALLPEILIGRYNDSWMDHPCYKPTMFKNGDKCFFLTAKEGHYDKNIVSADNAYFKREVSL